MIIYIVKKGDSLYKISRKFGTTIDRLAYDNQIADVSALAVGQALIVSSSDTHTAAAGDTIYKLSMKYGVTMGQLIAANPGLAEPSLIYPGQTIKIPENGKKRGIDVKGYTTKFSGAGLSETMPNLTYISPFSYEATAEGNLKAPKDASLLLAAAEHSVAPLLCVTNTSAGTGFSSDIAHGILSDARVADKLIKNLLAALDKGKYYGLSVDFEYVLPSDRENYNNFLRKMAPILHSRGYILTTAVAPKISANQAGTLYEAHDYPVHGEVCDYVIIMTYEWGYTFGPAMAVAPIGPVRQVLRYASSAIPSEKILMGMPNYGYDWTLPFTKGSAAAHLTNAGAVKRAAEVGAEIKYDETQQSPYYNYFDSAGKQHEVWFDDVRSISARLELVEEFDLAGISWWEVDSVFRQGQLALRSMYDVNKVIGK